MNSDYSLNVSGPNGSPGKPGRLPSFINYPPPFYILTIFSFRIAWQGWKAWNPRNLTESNVSSPGAEGTSTMQAMPEGATRHKRLARISR